MNQVALFCVCLAAWWTFMILMVLFTAYYRWWRMKRHIRKTPFAPKQSPRCLLLRPCAGQEEGLLTCLISIAEAKRDFPVEVRFGVDSDDDPARSVAGRAVDILNEKGIESSLLIIKMSGPNRKVSILHGLTTTGKVDHDIIISADSNTDLAGFDLNRFVAAITEDGASAVWCPPWIDISKRTIGNLAAQAVLHGSWHSFGLLGAIDSRGMVGKLFAVTRSALRNIGGFSVMVRYLGEDMEMSRRLRRSGHKVTRFPQSVKTVSGPASFGDAVARYARWIMVVKFQRRRLMVSYPLLFFNALIVYGLATFGMLYSVTLGGLCLLSAFLLRLLVGYSASRMLGLRPHLGTVAIQAVVADIVMLIAFVKALFMRDVRWRGRTLVFEPNGELKMDPYE
jgi:ceramide glucosyltransferase